MSVSNPEFLTRFKAGGDLSTSQYYAVKVSTDPSVVVCTAATDVPIGILYDKPTASGQGCNIAAFAPNTIIKWKVGSAGVTAGPVGPDSSGLAVTKTTDGDIVCARATKTWAAGDIAELIGVGPGIGWEFA
jgi:hypothetical protein